MYVCLGEAAARVWDSFKMVSRQKAGYEIRSSKAAVLNQDGRRLVESCAGNSEW
jgi:hypothetical protein